VWTPPRWSFAIAAIATNDGGYILTGEESQEDTGHGIVTNILVIKLDDQGSIVWSKTYNRGTGYDILTDDDDGYYVVGEAYTGEDGELYLMRIDHLGDSLWTRSYGTGAYAFTLRNLSDGNLLIGAAGSTLGESWNYRLTKIDGSGNTIWASQYGGASNEFFSALDIAANGDIALIGWADDGSLRAWLIVVDQAGNYLWDKTYQSNDGEPYGYNVLCTTDGGYLICMRNYVIKTDANGIIRCLSDFIIN